MKHYTEMTIEQALAWLIYNDPEAEEGFYNAQDPATLVETVGDNLRDFGPDIPGGWEY